MKTFGLVIVAIVSAYVAVCFGKIAEKHGKNPVFYGILSLVSPINLIVLGYWAFSNIETQKET